MRQSKLFSKTRREAPKDEVSKNAKLLIRAGFINKEMAGVYDYLPLGLRTLNKIVEIIREEMNALGGQEIQLSALQEKETWDKSGRWDDEVLDVWFKTKLKNDTELGLATTHEEPLTKVMSEHIKSYRDLPSYVYQFQTKFRNEVRAKSGILRVREFLMKDLYSFNKNQEELDEFYEKAKEAYFRVFKRVGLGDITHFTLAGGGSFSKYSHEFQTVCDAGEDLIYLDEDKNIALNKEVLNEEVLTDVGLKRENLKEFKSIEVGNIYKLGTKYSDALGLSFIDEEGNKKPVVMGSYGIGPGRVLGTVAEVLSDEMGLVWPKEIAPFQVHLILVSKEEDGEARKYAEKVYAELEKRKIEVLFDDRDINAGEKFADSDLIGIPTRVVVSERNLAEGKLEIKDRKTGEVNMLNEEAFYAMISA